MIRSWSHQLLIIYILTLYEKYAKIALRAIFESLSKTTHNQHVNNIIQSNAAPG